MPRPSTPDHEKLIARLYPETRRTILDRIAHRSPLVRVEYGSGVSRKLEDATTLVGTILGVAYSTAGQAEELIVRPADERLRLVAISAAHVLRIRAATPYGSARPGAFRLGEVLAGPPLTRTGAVAEGVAAAVARTLDQEATS